MRHSPFLPLALAGVLVLGSCGDDDTATTTVTTVGTTVTTTGVETTTTAATTATSTTSTTTTTAAITTTIADDGVLRPGDVEDAVQTLELLLQSIGYFPMTPDTIYDGDTEHWVKTFQRDYRLTVDGKVGPLTAALIEAIASGTSDAVLADPEGVEDVSFGSTVTSALPQLVTLLGSPDYSVGWEMGPCGSTPPYGGWEWYKVTWGGFTAWFTERDGPRLFDGWEITDLNGIPSNLYIAGGFGPATTWSDVAALGGVYDPFYGWWSAFDLGYGLGEFDVVPSNPPAGSAQVKGFGVGSAAVLYDC